MSAPMVLATLADAKTVTRRLTGLEKINSEPDDWQFVRLHLEAGVLWAVFADHRYPDKEEAQRWARCPYGVPGEGLWVRENFRQEDQYDHLAPSIVPIDTRVWFEADGDRPDWAGRLRPSIHMPRWLSRLDLEVGQVFPQRLVELTEDDAQREGVGKGYGCVSNYAPPVSGTYRSAFISLWDSINPGALFESNPWVWVINYKKLLIHPDVSIF